MKSRVSRASAPSRRASAGPYAGFARIDGSHPFKEAVSGGFVDYRARLKRGGKVLYFNFALAREMGLLAKDHADELNRELKARILETFGIVIINEYDEQQGIRYLESELKPGRYMATRYLQLQHPDKRGRTSGDGRGVWNGCFKGASGVTWDVSSQGTGATSLSPACAIEKKFFKTGDPKVSYGNGCSHVDEGLSAAITSEIFHRRGIATERVLAVIEYEGGRCINVRAARNLIRPAHLFRFLKLGDLAGLRGVTDLFIDRQISNGDWPRLRGSKERHEHLAGYAADTFARAVARFQADYVFCWLDWDGDNILADGGIIDYGSVRQFGLYHREYRYDDVDRFSTNIPGQRAKARYIVQTFAQASDFLVTGRKRSIRAFRNHPAVKRFDREFERALRVSNLRRLGLSTEQADYLAREQLPRVRQFLKRYSALERAKSSKGIYAVSDGITCDAVFSVMDAVRELPRRLLATRTPYEAPEFIELIRSGYARPRDLELTSSRVRTIRGFQSTYLELMRQVARKYRAGDLNRVLLEAAMRCSSENPPDRITGDGIIHVTTKLVRSRAELGFDELQRVIRGLIDRQTQTVREATTVVRGKAGRLLDRGLRALRDCREGF